MGGIRRSDKQNLNTAPEPNVIMPDGISQQKEIQSENIANLPGHIESSMAQDIRYGAVGLNIIDNQNIYKCTLCGELQFQQEITYRANAKNAPVGGKYVRIFLPTWDEWMK